MTDEVQGQKLVLGRLLRKWLHTTTQARDDGHLNGGRSNEHEERRINLRALKEMEWLGPRDSIHPDGYRQPCNLCGLKQQDVFLAHAPGPTQVGEAQWCSVWSLRNPARGTSPVWLGDIGALGKALEGFMWMV